jgi:hypothetical protein
LVTVQTASSPAESTTLRELVSAGPVAGPATTVSPRVQTISLV